MRKQQRMIGFALMGLITAMVLMMATLKAADRPPGMNYIQSEVQNFYFIMDVQTSGVVYPPFWIAAVKELEDGNLLVCGSNVWDSMGDEVVGCGDNGDHFHRDKFQQGDEVRFVVLKTVSTPAETSRCMYGANYNR